MGKIIERLLPVVFALVIAVVCFGVSSNFFTNKDFLSTLNSTISVSAVLVGFLSTMIAILASSSSSESRVINTIKELNLMEGLTVYFYCALVSGFLLAISSTILSLTFEKAIISGRILSAFLGFLGAYFIATTFRVMLIMLNFLKALYTTDEGNQSSLVVSSSEKAFPNAK